MLILATIATSIAWFVERSRNTDLVAAHKQELKDVTDGALLWGFAIREHAISSVHRDSPSELTDNIRRGLVGKTFKLFHWETKVNKCLTAIDSSDTARFTANRLLAELECKSFDEYFPLFLERFDFEIYEEYKDTSSPQHQELKEFINESIANPRRFRGFPSLNGPKRVARYNNGLHTEHSFGRARSGWISVRAR